MADIVPSLFGLTPGMYQQAQQQRGDEMALQYAKLDPFQQANYAIGRGAYGLAGAAGGLLGGQDPELQRITARQQIASQINPSDPASIQQGIMALQQAGDTQGAMMLQGEFQKMQESMALVGQRKAASVASLAQAGRERTQATPEKIQLAKEIARLAGPEGSPEYLSAYRSSLLGEEKTEKPIVVGNALVNPITGAVIYQSPNEKLDAVVVGGNLVDKSTGKVIFTAPEKPTTEPTTNELTNARAIAAQAGPVGSPEYNAAFNTEYQRLTAEKAPKPTAAPSVGGDRQAVALEIYDKPFDQLTTEQRAAVNKRVEAEQKSTASAGAAKFVMPGTKALADIPAFRASVQRTIEPQLKTITATDQALQAIDDSLATNNFAAYRAAQVQFARAIAGAGDLSQKELKAAGADPSVLGGTADYLSTLFSSTPTADTQKKIRSTLQAIRTVSQRQASNEVEQQRKIALRSPAYDPEAVKEALMFPELMPSTSLPPTATGSITEQAAAEIKRRAAARTTSGGR